MIFETGSWGYMIVMFSSGDDDGVEDNDEMVMLVLIVYC